VRRKVQKENFILDDKNHLDQGFEFLTILRNREKEHKLNLFY